MLPTDEGFDLRTPDAVVFGRDTATRTGEFAGKHGEHALLVTDPGIVDAGLLKPVETSLAGAGLSTDVFNGVRPDPTVSMAVECAEAAASVGADVIVGVGGGSVLDVAKAGAVVRTTDGAVDGLFGRNRVDTRGVPTVLLPTTAGTGSEVSPACVLRDAGGQKRGIVDDSLFADAAIVDPDLAMTLPLEQTRATGLDAFAHAIGSYMSTDANTFADILCTGAMELIEANLRAATYHGRAVPRAREQMSLAATTAMIGRVNGGKAAIHSIAYGIQATYDVPHGRAIAMVLPETVEYNLPACTDKLAVLGTRIYEGTGSVRERAAACISGLRSLRSDVGLDVSLRAVGASEGDMDSLAELAVQSERHLEANPRPVEVSDARSILEQIY